ncbi:Ribosomal protein S18 acetylase RimI [Flavobacteriaceae bacterium MAR_2010_188]|nr:Ribosomal protein S18 acetylase RimI [Flavobacteriaceae bacterium MAR_2010_188]
MNLSFIKCTFDDLKILREFSISTFCDAFEAKNNAEDFKIHLDYSFSKQKLRFELLNPNSEFYFAFLEKELVGYLKMNYNDAQTERFYPNAVELERLYIDKDHQRNGYGEILLQFAINKAKTRNPPFLWLGVWEENLDGIRFYEKHGFKKFETHPYFIGTEQQTDWLMRLTV